MTDEIVNIVCSLKNGAPGYDELTTSLLKFSLPLIKHQLLYLCNLSIDQGIFSEELKLANVCPLFKSGDSMCLSNYRPVSLLCVLSKVFEKVMYSRIPNFIEVNH